MKQTNRFSKLLFALGASAFLFSCNNSSNETSTKTDTTKMDTTAVTPPPTSTAPAGPAVPFDVAIIYHSVKDYAAWRPGFDTDSTARRASGLGDIVVGKKVGKPNDVEIVLMASDIAKAKAFAADPRLKDVMQKNGVTSKPEIDYWHVIRFDAKNDASSSTWAEVTHKVKDFDTWVKAFDAEASMRPGFGLADAVLARGIDDPNLVYIVFAVTDMDKAKARMASPELKKIMMDAGVVGAPKVAFYSDASK